MDFLSNSTQTTNTNPAALRENGCDGRPLHAHVEAENKDGIQRNVESGADEHRGHPHAGKALTNDELIPTD